MIKYDIHDTFVNNDVAYPFNIKDMDGVIVDNFWTVIDAMLTEIKDGDSKDRFIWIDAEGYCQTEIFLKKLLLQHHDHICVLYLHWLDFANNGRTIYKQLALEKVDNSFFIDNKSLSKICVIDHAEAIGQREQYLELCKKFCENKCLFIFLSKKDRPDFSYWKNLIAEASSSDEDCYLGIARCENNYYQVSPYTCSQCADIFSSAIVDSSIRDKSISLAHSLPKELRRPFYFDLLIKELIDNGEAFEALQSFSDFDLVNRVYGAALGGAISHIIGVKTFDAYIREYYKSDFVTKYPLGDQPRIPSDNYVWASGVIRYALKSTTSYEEVISTQFEYNKYVQNRYSDEQIKEQIKAINIRIITVFCSEEINDKFVLEDYFTQMVGYSLTGAQICASVLNECFEQVAVHTIEAIFRELGRQYGRELSSEEDIRSHFLLGIEIGKLLPKINVSCVAEGLGYLFSSVRDDYVEPKCNSNGVSVIPVTNFEFEKFINDNGYATYYSFKSDTPLNDIAVSYYNDIFNFIIGALSGNNRKDSRCLAYLLKGYGWDQYKKTAYLLSKKDTISNSEIYKAIAANYPDQLSHPAKWVDCSNTDVARAFCNPLQPVVCVNIFEARAYAGWLASKIGKPVRLLMYDPDYLSIIGAADVHSAETLRRSFLSHLEEKRAFINSAENDKLFYGGDDIEIKEPSPVAMPNSKFLELYDFVGNVFETQDTPFTYNYGKNDEAIKSELKKSSEALVDYNCPGGGLQRTAANWPPEYMGQVPAFLRNQDIGFRIAIGDSLAGSQKHKNRALERIRYSDGTIETYIERGQRDRTGILDNILLKWANSQEVFEDYFLRSNVFSCEEKHVIVFTRQNVEGNSYTESILLMLLGEDVFAYHLTGIASTKNDGKHGASLRMVMRDPIIHKDLASRRKYKNLVCAKWVDYITITDSNHIDTCVAYPLNISNGCFQIVDKKILRSISDGLERKTTSSLVGSYEIGFCPDSQDFKNSYYDKLKRAIGPDFFLPDWIDIVGFMNYIAADMPKTDELDIEMVMAAITTVDTSDLHEQINKKILSEKKGEKDNG